MKPFSEHFFKVFSLWVLTSSFATGQDVGEPDTIDIDTLRSKQSLVGVSFDYGKLFTIWSNEETKLEAALDFTLNEKLQFLGEVGYAKLSPSEAIKNGSYTSSGLYQRFGVAYGGEIVPTAYLYIGALYGRSNFNDEAEVLISSDAWDDIDEVFNRDGLKATWFEILIVTEGEFKGPVRLGAKLRFRRILNFSDVDPEVYSIPGFGPTFNKSVPAFNLYIKYTLGL